jgi:hypothetical protein
MIDPISYLPTVAWRTFFDSVLPVQGEDWQYTCDVAPIDVTEPGFGILDIGFHIADNVGNVFRIIEINGNNIKVEDDFHCGFAPLAGHQGIVYQAADLGRGAWLLPVFSLHLSKNAIDRIRARETSVLWRTREIIPFAASANPEIVDYQDNWVFIYGEYPSTTLVVTDGSDTEQVRQDVPVRNLVNGKLDSIKYVLPFPRDGYIILSR